MDKRRKAGGKAGGSDWVRSQAEAQRAARAALTPVKTHKMTEKQLKELGIKMAALTHMAQVMQQRVQRLASWNAEHVQRIVQLRGQLREQWERGNALDTQLQELRTYVAAHGGGWPIRASVQRDGQFVEGWVTMEPQEGVTSVPTLADLHSATSGQRSPGTEDVGEDEQRGVYRFNEAAVQLAVLAEPSVKPQHPIRPDPSVTERQHAVNRAAEAYEVAQHTVQSVRAAEFPPGSTGGLAAQRLNELTEEQTRELEKSIGRALAGAPKGPDQGAYNDALSRVVQREQEAMESEQQATGVVDPSSQKPGVNQPAQSGTVSDKEE